jgi:steroid delta-isomerase-like uncharacterized protein
MTTLHHNKRLWQKHVLAENRRSIEGLLDTLCDNPTYILMATDQIFQGRAGVAQFYTGLFEAVPDANFELRAQFIGEEGVVEESSLVGMHTGPLFGIPPTDKIFRLPLIIVFPMQGDKFWGERVYFDMDTLKNQLGLA